MDKSNQRPECDQQIAEFFTFHDELSIIDSVILKGDWVVIPVKIHYKILEILHIVHQDMEKIIMNQSVCLLAMIT